MTDKPEVIGSSVGLVPTNVLMGSAERGFQDVDKSQLALAEYPPSDRIAFARCTKGNRTAPVPSGEKSRQYRLCRRESGMPSQVG